MKHVKTYEINQFKTNLKSRIGEMLFHKFFSDNNDNIIKIGEYAYSSGFDIYFKFSETLDSRYFKDITKMCDYLVNSFNIKKTNIYINSTSTSTYRGQVELIIYLESDKQIEDLEDEAYKYLTILKDKSDYNL